MARGTIVTRRQKDGTKRYATVIRIGGRQRWKTFAKRKDAEAYLDKNSTDIREGTYRELKRSTFDGYVKSWSKTHMIPEKLKPSTINGYSSALSKHLLPAFRSYQMTAIDAEAISALESKLLRGGKSPKHTRNVLQVLSRIFADARREGYIRFSPMAEMDLMPLKTEEGRALTPDEAQALLKECGGVLKLIVMLGLLAGLRRTEIFALRWQDIDFATDLIRIRQNLFWRYGKYQELSEDEPAFTFTAPKTKTSTRDVDLSPALKDALWTHYMEMQMEGKTGLIFQTSNGTPHDPGNVYDRWFQPAVEAARKKACEEARKEAVAAGRPLNEEEFTFLKDVTLHALRHTFGSWKIAQGEDIVYVSRQMGHANVSITANVYAHLIDNRRPQAAAKTDAFLFGKKVSAD